jgi:hypothetical protein
MTCERYHARITEDACLRYQGHFNKFGYVQSHPCHKCPKQLRQKRKERNPIWMEHNRGINFLAEDHSIDEIRSEKERRREYYKRNAKEYSAKYKIKNKIGRPKGTRKVVIPNEKTCKTCGILKPIEGFYLQRTPHGDYRRVSCRECENKRRSKKNENHTNSESVPKWNTEAPAFGAA